MPKNYDSEINNKLKSYRYRRTDDDIPEITEKTSESSIGDFDIKHTRSGRVYNISMNMISKKYVNEVQNCTVKALENKKHESKNILRSCLKHSYDIRKIGMPDIPNVVPHYDITQLKQMAACSIEKIKKFTEIPKKSTFTKGNNCMIKMEFLTEPNHRMVRFSHTLIIFYD